MSLTSFFCRLRLQSIHTMRKLFILLSLFLSLSSSGQDTTVVQTFTFDSITTRRGIFQFPDSSEQFRKILMAYRLKCDAATTADQYPCGEWDYLTYTNVYHKTGLIDSILYQHPRYKSGIQSFDSLGFCTQYPTYFLKNTDIQTLEIDSLIDEFSTVISDSGLFFEIPTPADSKRSRLIFSIPIDSINNGMQLPYPISSLGLHFNNPGQELKNCRIRFKETANPVSDSDFLYGNWQTVFHGNVSLADSGWTEIIFNSIIGGIIPGTQNLYLKFELSFDYQSNTQPLKLYVSDSTNTSSIISNQRDACIRTEEGKWIELPANNLADSINQQISIVFWQYGTAAGATNTFFLNAVNAQGNRILNIHLPWSDSNIYWDAGFGSGSYDRINKSAQTSEYLGQWTHWAFIKNAQSGSMKIYRNGILWHSGNGKMKPMNNISQFYVGCSNTKTGFYPGKINEFSIWNKELTALEIQNLMQMDPSNQDFNPENLICYYSFDDQTAQAFEDVGGSAGLALNMGGVWQESLHPDELFKNTSEFPYQPKLKLSGGNYSFNSISQVLTDTIFYSPLSIIEYQINSQNFVAIDTNWYYPGGNSPILNENGQIIDSIQHPVDFELINTQLQYYGNTFEVVETFEIGRFITPYGIGLSLGNNGFEWLYDVTDYAPILKGEVDLSAGNQQELLDLKFYFIGGIPAREVKQITQVWGGLSSISYKDLDNNIRLQEKTIALNPDADNFRLKTRLTGHGHNSNDGSYPHCCEWKPNDHYLLLNQDTVSHWMIWQNKKCAQNPVYPQGGTWPGPREGWCPGDKVDDQEFELTQLINSDTITLDYEITDVPADNLGMGNGNYVISMHLMQYSAPANEIDAEIEEILNPTSAAYYSRTNPMCETIRIKIRNNGSDTLFTATLSCSVDGGEAFDYQWHGTLAPFESQIVQIPVPNSDFWTGQEPPRFKASIVNPNNQPDEYPEDNTMSTAFKRPDVYKVNFIIVYLSNNFPEENWYEVRDIAGNLHFARYTAEPNTLYYDTLDLPNGCYSINLIDSGLDGLSYWAYPEQGNGFFRLKKNGGANLKTFEAEFGHQLFYSFTIEEEIQSPEYFEADFTIYPNPGNGEFHIAGESAGAIQIIEVHDASGRKMMSKSYDESSLNQISINLNRIPDGIYFLILRGDRFLHQEKIILIRP